MNINPYIKFAIDEATSSNDWLTRYEDRTYTELRKHKAHAKAKRLQKRTQSEVASV